MIETSYTRIPIGTIETENLIPKRRSVGTDLCTHSAIRFLVSRHDNVSVHDLALVYIVFVNYALLIGQLQFVFGLKDHYRWKNQTRLFVSSAL